MLFFFLFQVILYNIDQDGSDSLRSSFNNSFLDQSLVFVNLNSVGSVYSYILVSFGEVNVFVEYLFSV